METKQITKQIIDFQKMSFDNLYNAMALVQDQAVTAMDTMLDQTSLIPEDGRKALQSWMGVIQDERTRLKGYVDNGFVALEKACCEAPKPAGKAKKAAS